METVNTKIILLEERIEHVKELFDQRDELTNRAIDKAEEGLIEKLDKISEFYNQLKDVISTLSRDKETTDAIDNLRNQMLGNNKIIDDKATASLNHILSRVELFKTLMDDKLDMGIKSAIDRAEGIEKQLRMLISANQEAIKVLNEWRTGMQGSVKVILALGGFVVAIVIALLVAYIRSVFKMP